MSDTNNSNVNYREPVITPANAAILINEEERDFSKNPERQELSKLESPNETHHHGDCTDIEVLTDERFAETLKATSSEEMEQEVSSNETHDMDCTHTQAPDDQDPDVDDNFLDGLIVDDYFDMSNEYTLEELLFVYNSFHPPVNMIPEDPVGNLFNGEEEMPDGDLFQ